MDLKIAASKLPNKHIFADKFSYNSKIQKPKSMDPNKNMGKMQKNRT